MPAGKFDDPFRFEIIVLNACLGAGNLLKALEYTSGELYVTHADRFSMGEVRFWFTLWLGSAWQRQRVVTTSPRTAPNDVERQLISTDLRALTAMGVV
jgi:hypothetical protein